MFGRGSIARSAVLWLAALVVLGSPVHGGVSEGNGEIGFDFGFTDFDTNRTSDAGVCGSLRGGYHFTDLFQLEGQLMSATATDYSAVGVFNVDMTMSAFLVNAVFNFHPSDDIVPYVLAGAGRVTSIELTPVFGAGIEEDAGALQAAAGARFFFGKSKRAAVRLEGSLLREDSFDDDATHTSLTAGFTWRLGPAY